MGEGMKDRPIQPGEQSYALPKSSADWLPCSATSTCLIEVSLRLAT